VISERVFSDGSNAVINTPHTPSHAHSFVLGPAVINTPSPPAHSFIIGPAVINTHIEDTHLNIPMGWWSGLFAWGEGGYWRTCDTRDHEPRPVCVFITAGPSTKLFACGGGNIGGHVLRETTSRGLCGLVCPWRTSERGGEGDCVKECGGTREEPGTLTVCVYFNTGCQCVFITAGQCCVTQGCCCLLLQGGALFSLVPLVWELNPKLQGRSCSNKHTHIYIHLNIQRRRRRRRIYSYSIIL
jgi:hypothetical protein